MLNKFKKKKTAPISLAVLIIIIIAYCIIGPKKNIDQRLADFRSLPLAYTTHAKCRMACRNINSSEVIEVIKFGRINYQKSDLKDKPCATYAVEKEIDQHKIRIIVASCKTVAKVITVIDLDQEFECNCN